MFDPWLTSEVFVAVLMASVAFSALQCAYNNCTTRFAPASADVKVADIV